MCKLYLQVLKAAIDRITLNIYRTIIMLFSTDSVRLVFAQAGRGQTSSDGWTHRKTDPYVIIAQATEGRYEIECLGGPCGNLRPGEAFLTKPNLPLTITHHCDRRTGMMTMRWIHFNFLVFNAVNLSSLFDFPISIEKKWADRFGDISDQIFDLQQSPEQRSLRSVSEINRIMFELLVIFLNFLSEKGQSPAFDPGVQRLLPALQHARRNLSARLEVKDLARVAGISVPRFHAEFKKLIGEPPIDHLRKMRLSAACNLLMTKDLSLDGIARATGFCDQFHFSREFRKNFGHPPSEFRSNIRRGFAL